MPLKEEKSWKNKSYIIYYIIAFIILILIVVYFTFFRLDVEIKSNKVLRCSDGTLYDSCSTNKPLYCLNGSLESIPIKCGCGNGLVLAVNECKNATDLLPESNYSCKELVPQKLIIKFNNYGSPTELIDTSNSLINDVPLKNVPGKYCLTHAPAKSGENINVGNIFYCYAFSNAGGNIDSEGIIKKSYKISYEFVMDKGSCVNSTSYATGSSKTCQVNSINCSWVLTN
jgi:hypothetical protein